MMDVAKENGVEIDLERLRSLLGCPVIPVVAATREGIAGLRAAALDAARNQHTAAAFRIPYGDAVEDAVAKLLPKVEERAASSKLDPRWLGLRLLEGDFLARRTVGAAADNAANALRDDVEQALGDDIDITLADARYGFVNRITDGALKRKRQLSGSLSDRI